MIEQTFVLIKPDGVKRSLIGEILKRFENMGLKVVAMKMTRIKQDFAKKHYSAHINKQFYKPLEQYITSGPLVAMVLEGVEAVSVVRKMIGHTEPKQALPGTIRGDYAHQSIGSADKSKKSVENIIHASGTSEEAETEIKLWFKKDEIYRYKTVHEAHTF